MNYRPHIDGLRAVAVLGVVAYHFGLSSLPGGFVGVDVFFVISGFLISKSLYIDIEANRFSLAHFYERRIRRIAPAFLFVTALTWVAAQFILFPRELVQLSDALIFGTLFSANIYFYRTSGYFAPAADELPLLHLWSLGVEEQFYILFPFLVMLVHSVRPRALPMVLGFLFFSSLVASEFAMRKDPSAAFYLLPFRAFELLSGAILALPGLRAPSNPKLADMMMAAGLLVILCAMLFVTSGSRFPGALAVLPCAGAALVIWAGEGKTASMARLLGHPVLCFFGRISFSLYLVHWPLAVFARMVMPELSPSAFLAGGMAVSTLLAWLSWAYVEQPFRRQSPPELPRRSVVAMSAAAAAGLMVTGVVVRAAGGFPQRQTAEVNEVLAFRDYAYQETFREGTCFLRPEQLPADLGSECLPTGASSIVLWGSSHIAQFYGGLQGPVAQNGYQLGQITGSACIPLLNWDHPGRPNCRALNDFAIRWLLRHKPAMVVSGGDPITDQALLALLDRSIATLAGAGIKVVLLGPVPYYKRAVPVILAERLQNEQRDDDGSLELQPTTTAAESIMRSRYRDRLDVTYISFLERLCPVAGCPIAEGSAPLHFDTAHFTAKGSERYGRRLAAILFDLSRSQARSG